MLLIYMFLYVFSLSIPVFYHSAFLVGVLASIHCLFVHDKRVFKLTKYQFTYFSAFLIGYIIIGGIVVLKGTNDFTFFKTYTNSFLSALCAVPLVVLFNEKFKGETPFYIMEYLFKIFLIQSIIILLVLFIPQLKPLVTTFQRDPDLANELDQFSNGLRTNALSGGLFFGLSLSFALALILFVYYEFIINFRLNIFKVLLFIIVNIGLICTGRFGFVYVLCILPLLLSMRFKNKLRFISFVFFMVVLFSALFFMLYQLSPYVKNTYDNIVYPYAFEFLSNYNSSGSFDTSSTNQLASMYDVKITYNTWLFGDGIYTGTDGLYYQHTDVGYLRLLLLGGGVLNAYFIIFTILTLFPLLRLKAHKGSALFFSILLLFILSQFKGEAMVTLVQLNNMCFLICSSIILSKRKTEYE